ncbi:MAG: mannose-1-phosphate guanylyltransferase [Candidatus Hydrogenedentes bacterium]|nr:mannose-1-phosphate guanylyltransferase [Candidatus Hydrogenedentota bacterium]
MAGGSGERFWPVSRRNRPKQLLRLASETKTMLEQAIDRLGPLFTPERIFVVTSEELAPSIREAGVGIPDKNVLAEPCKRNTAGCLVYAAAHLLARFPDDPELSMAVVTADHRIGDEEVFLETVDVALNVAEQESVLVTHGITPTHPDTGYGYIQIDKSTSSPIAPDAIPVHPAIDFQEKPDLETAKKYLDTGDYLWNSGMFFWRLDVFLSELDQATPDLSDAVRGMAAALGEGDEKRVRELFEGLDNISIDYALMEKSKNVAVVRANYSWEDIGVWTSLERTRERDARGNVTQGDPVLVDCDNCIVYNDVGADEIAVSVVGVQDLIVAVSRDGILVIPKDCAQDVRLAVEELKRRNAKQL